MLSIDEESKDRGGQVSLSLLGGLASAVDELLLLTLIFIAPRSDYTAVQVVRCNDNCVGKISLLSGDWTLHADTHTYLPTFLHRVMPEGNAERQLCGQGNIGICVCERETGEETQNPPIALRFRQAAALFYIHAGSPPGGCCARTTGDCSTNVQQGEKHPNILAFRRSYV